MENNEVKKYEAGTKYPIVKTKFDNEAAKVNYQATLQNLAAITVTRDNVNEDLTKTGRQILKSLEEEKDLQSKEPRKWHEDIMEVYKSLKNPLEEHIKRIGEEKKVIATQVQKEINQQQQEQARIMAAKNAIIEFCNKVALSISNATTDDDIVSIEKLIGLEKTKKTVYQEFLQELIDKCDALRPQIKTQKENVRQLQTLKEQEEAALESGDVVAAAEMRGKKEYFQQVVHETGLQIHETAFMQASAVDVIAPEIIDQAPKGRSNWKWRVDDIKLLQKKMPHLVKLVPDDEALDLLLKTKKADGSLVGKEEEVMFGVVFFNDKTFK
jgi:hypothetical protein